MINPDFIHRGDTFYLAYDHRGHRWNMVSNPDQCLADGHTILEGYVVNKFSPAPPPPRKIPKYRPTFKPMSARTPKRKLNSMMKIAVDLAN